MKPRLLPQEKPKVLIAVTRVAPRYLCIARVPWSVVFVMTTVLDPAADTADPPDVAGCTPAACRIGLLGLGNVGSAFARMSREAAAPLAHRRLAPVLRPALVRTLARPRP